MGLKREYSDTTERCTSLLADEFTQGAGVLQRIGETGAEGTPALGTAIFSSKPDVSAGAAERAPFEPAGRVPGPGTVIDGKQLGILPGWAMVSVPKRCGGVRG
jgi:hypothetical protein